MSDGEATPQGIADSPRPVDWASPDDTVAGTLLALPDDEPVDADARHVRLLSVPSPADMPAEPSRQHTVARKPDVSGGDAPQPPDDPSAETSDSPDSREGGDVPIPLVDRARKHRIAAAVAIAAALMLVGMVSVLSWAASLGGGTGDPVSPSTPGGDAAGGEGPGTMQPVAVPSDVSSLEISFAAEASVTAYADGQELSWDAAKQAASGALGDATLACDGDAVTLTFGEGACPASVYLSMRGTDGGFASWKSSMSSDDGKPMSFSGNVGGLPEAADVAIDLPGLTVACSPRGEGATPVITMSLSMPDTDGASGETADAALALGKGAADAALTMTMREVTMRSSNGVGHGTKLTGTKVSPTPGADAGQKDVGGTVTLDDGVREYVANYDELEQRAADDGKPQGMPALVTDASDEGDKVLRPVSTEGGKVSLDLDGNGRNEELSVQGGGDEPLSLSSDAHGSVELSGDGTVTSAATGQDADGIFLAITIEARDDKSSVTKVRLRNGQLVAE